MSEWSREDAPIPKFLSISIQILVKLPILKLRQTLKLDTHLIHMRIKYAVLLNTQRFFNSLFKIKKYLCASEYGESYTKLR